MESFLDYDMLDLIFNIQHITKSACLLIQIIIFLIHP